MRRATRRSAVTVAVAGSHGRGDGERAGLGLGGHRTVHVPAWHGIDPEH